MKSVNQECLLLLVLFLDLTDCFHSHQNFSRDVTLCRSALNIYSALSLTQLQGCLTNKPSFCKKGHERLHSYLFCSPRHQVNIARSKNMLSP